MGGSLIEDKDPALIGFFSPIRLVLSKKRSAVTFLIPIKDIQPLWFDQPHLANQKHNKFDL